jgi:hypothetical protein
MPTMKVEFSGKVVLQPVDVGSKSEREAVVLKLSDGAQYILRRADGPSFGDSGLEELVGSSIRVLGTTVGSTLIMRDWKKIAALSN